MELDFMTRLGFHPQDDLTAYARIFQNLKPLVPGLLDKGRPHLLFIVACRPH